MNNPSSNFGFALHTNGNGQAYWKKFIASENSTNVPEIDITYYYPKPVVTSVSNGPGKESGYFNLSWNPVQGATSYDVAIYNGSEYQTINVGASNSWSTEGKGIWPTKEEIEKGIYKLHTDQKGAELALDPSTVYANAYNANGGADYSNSHQYWIHIIARFSDGSVAKTQDADAWMQLGTPVPKGTLFPNLANAKTGYAQLEWEPIPGATGYKVLIYNGKAYEEFDVQNNTNWTSQGENIWPTDAEIEAGKYLLHHDKNGQDLARDPSPVYVNSKGNWPTSIDYWIAVKAYSTIGYSDSTRSSDFTDIFPTDNITLGMEDYWAQIPVKLLIRMMGWAIASP